MPEELERETMKTPKGNLVASEWERLYKGAEGKPLFHLLGDAGQISELIEQVSDLAAELAQTKASVEVEKHANAVWAHKYRDLEKRHLEECERFKNERDEAIAQRDAAIKALTDPLLLDEFMDSWRKSNRDAYDVCANVLVARSSRINPPAPGKDGSHD